MPIKTTFVALLFVAGPTLAAGCPGHEMDTTAASCMPGMVWDAEKEACVEQTTS